MTALLINPIIRIIQTARQFVRPSENAASTKFKSVNQTRSSTMSINIGMSDQQRESIAKGLSQLLANSYTLYLKTHNYHWNVRGPMFHSLHTMFETQYNELALAVDEIAERIRALGFLSPGSYSEFAALSSIKEGDSKNDAHAMIRELVEGQETIVRICREIFPLAEEAADEPTVDLLTIRMKAHEKTAWMLRVLLEK
ncbi:DNA protection during starvation protein 2 [Neisseria bacilliformis ATCC BAA-1200]|uniref:DNA protection during starvation protein 2 n=2 Tax=Neisseria TaxID=482 RepID=F2BEA3_9NEIS|nr:DNA protection during starvation protein 2 [Neisseria bacilliformis ATCC BAA-1200]